MSNLFWLSEEQFEKIKPLLPNDVRGVPRVDDRRVLSGIIHVIKHGLRWSDCPAEYGPAKTIYNRYARWGEKGVFSRLFAALVAEAGPPDSLAIDSTHVKVHRTAGSGRKKGGADRSIGDSRGGRNSKIHAVTDQKGRPVVLVLTAGQVSDFVPAQQCLEAAPKAAAVIADRGYDSDELRDFIQERGAKPVIPPKKNRRVQYRYDKALYKTRHHIERFFCRLKDFRRVATRYDRQPYIFMAAVFLASMVAFWL
jgi:transposase